MLSGDQHLATVIHHGIDEFGDAGYSFSVLSIVNHYPRFWRPKAQAVRTLSDNVFSKLKDTGDYYDSLNNKITMYRYANPGENKALLQGRAPQAQQATGHGLVKFNKKTREITIECWPRGTDAAFAQDDSKQYPG